MQIIVIVVVVVLYWYVFGDCFIYCGFNGVNVIVNQCVDQFVGGVNFVVGYVLDKWLVVGVVFFNVGFLFDNLWVVEIEMGFMSDDKVIVQCGGDRYIVKVVDGVGDDVDYWGVVVQVDNCGVNIGDGGQIEVGFLQMYVVGFEVQYCLCWDIVVVIFCCQFQCGGYFGVGYFVYIVVLEGVFDGNYYCRLVVDCVFGDYYIVIGLWDDVLGVELW